METISPPMTPIRPSMSPLNISPANSYREQSKRRNSSFSSNHDRSPASIRKNRFSNASQYSNDFSPVGGVGEGMGNLADELDELDEDIDIEQDTTDVAMDGVEGGERQASPVDGARDSGVDVSYTCKQNSPRSKNFSKPFSIPEKPPDEVVEEEQDKLSPELEEAMNNITRMTSSSPTTEDPIIPRTVALLQDLGNQSNLEANTQRLMTSINSMTSHLTAQCKAVQTLFTSLYSPIAMSAPLEPATIEETIPLIEVLLKELPLPDTAPLQGLRKLERDTNEVARCLSHLTDTLQMGKQATNTASRHLRTTQTIVAELRRERERAEEAKFELSRTGWDEKLRQRWCAGQCEDVIAGFERRCQALRDSLERGAGIAT